MRKVKSFFIFYNGQNIKADREIESMSAYICIGRRGQKTDFLVIHCLLRPSVLKRRTSLNLNDYQHIPFLGNNINLLPVPPPVRFTNNVTLSL